MPVDVDYLRADDLVVIALLGDCSPEEFSSILRDEILPHVQSLMPRIIHIVIDFTHLNWGFQDFTRHLEYAKERRATNAIPENLRQHWVGSNAWINNYRTWIGSKYGEAVNMFISVDAAIAYLRESTT